jgi:hypothetical protein
MQAGGSLVEVMSSAGAGVLGVLFVNRFIIRARFGPPRELASPMGAYR